MNSDRWQEVCRVYESALKLGASERDAYLRDACAGDQELWREVETLLTRRASHQISSPAGAIAAGDLDTHALTEGDAALSVEPRRIGPYRLLQRIGEGGMAEVWLAEQTTPVHRRVAIKLIKAGMDTKAMISRFESERQALALMDHPAIAKVLDGGATAEGRPYFAMEYVLGTQITEYCDKYHLAMRDRLDLFILVCDGVQHAHQKAVIHRDLKPSNILITLQDAKPVPKIIDFGVAKAIGQPITGRTLFTQVGVLIGTPEYMSPEQTELTVQNIDTRTDVYSLGLILYELLVGALPFDARELRRAGFEEILRRIRDEEPPRPSAKVRTLGETSTTCARNRNTEPRTLARQLEGDLDLIVLKALEKDRTRRYGSPSDLAADITRHLHDEPVLASTPSVTYRARKFVRRHRSGVGVAAGVLLLLMGAAVTMTSQAQRLARERDRANQEAAVSRQVTDLLTGLFRVADPSETRGNQITAREILDRGARLIDIELRAQPEIQARLMHTMGIVYTNLGLYRQAQELLERAVETERRTLGAEHRDTLSATNALGLVYIRRDRWSDAEAMFRNTLEISQRVLGPDHRQTASTMTLLAEVLMRRQRAAYRENVGSAMSIPEAETLYRRAMDISLQALGPEHLETLTNRAGLGTLYAFQNRHREAEKELRETLSIARRVLGPEDAFTLNVTGLLSQALLSAERYPEAESVARDFVAARAKVLGQEHPLTLVAQTLLARDLLYQERYKDVERLSKETLEIERRVQPEAKNTFDTWFNLFAAYKGQRRYADADKVLREMLAIARRAFGENDAYTNHVIENFGVIAALRGRRDEAFVFLKQAVDHGFRTYEGIANDEDLNSLHGDPRFDELLADLRRRVEADR